MAQHFTWEEAKEYMREYNRKHGFRQGNMPTSEVKMVAVMKNKGFNRDDYTDEERSYVFSSNNKAFLDGMLGYSIFSYNLADPETDRPRLENYLEYSNCWEVDYCYILTEED